jgi:hypothetical protein
MAISREAVIFTLGAVVSLVSSLATVVVSHVLVVMRDNKARRREVLEKVGAWRAKRGEINDSSKYHQIVSECMNLPDDVISVYLGALKEWTR